MPESSWSAADHRYMALALQLAEKGLYTTRPNPRVGCVLVKNDVIVGQGWHRKAGEPHAEIMALRDAGEEARGATAYVTLEPCSHHGKTGPCAEALLRAGVQAVIAAMQDPNPEVSGRGFALLDSAGVTCSHGLLEAQARELNPGFIARMTRHQPYVRLKLAASIDGRTAMASGESKWITGPHARSDVQRLRARSDAIITAAGTVEYDNPALTVRPEQLGLPNGEEIARLQPVRVVLDDEARLSGNEQVFAAPGQVVYCVREGAKLNPSMHARQHVTVVEFDAGWSRKQCLRALLTRLVEEFQCNEVLVEAGAGLAGSVLEAEVCDELWLYMASKLMGNTARPLVTIGIESMADARSLCLQDVRMVGDDVCLRYRVAPHQGRA